MSVERFRRTIAALALAGVLAAGVWTGAALVRARTANAAQDAQDARAALARLEDLSAIFKQVGRAVEPSVVSIEVTRVVQARSGGNPMEEQLRRFFDRDGDGESDVPGNPFDRFFGPDGFRQEGQGSGVIIAVEGDEAYVVTNNHVAGGAKELTIRLADGREITDASLVGTDPKTDIAVVRIKGRDLVAAPWADSTYLERGDIVLAFGSPFGYVGSMTQGIVSGLNRQTRILGQQGYEDFIQVDAAINPGNSGGPLVNLRGEVVGINTAIASRTGGFQGIGFAIPSNLARTIYEQLRRDGRVVRGWLGVSIADVSALRDQARATGFEGDRGVFVAGTMRQTPAWGKLQEGDVITALNGADVADTAALRNQIAASRPGTDVTLTVVRGGKPREISITIGEQPDDLLAGATAPSTGAEAPSATAESIGLRLADPTPESLEQNGLPAGESGALITGVANGSLAQGGGLKVGDLITRVGAEAVGSARAAAEAIRKADASKGIALHVTDREGSRFVFLQDARR